MSTNLPGFPYDFPYVEENHRENRRSTIFPNQFPPRFVAVNTGLKRSYDL